MRSSPISMMFQPTRRMMRPVPKEEQAGVILCFEVEAIADLLDAAAHTVSQRLRRLRKIPPELLPLGAVVAFAVAAAGYSIARKFYVDKNLRLARQNRAADEAGEHHEAH
ncbi:hypothetical protein NKR23_g4421 [Pleurostoma richardsiae]|uniref:Uncharacterized protein n=1 Tax=Pleurostoma richardsiae TaxID=41990 RepID=A0AA38RRN9_9PEZI|nr:hypothetical protein NKR23_g4421 [Pleurostoma richardsiae]